MCKEPPYKVEESGYAGFIMLIEVYFKNKVRASVSGKEAPVTLAGARLCEAGVEVGLGHMSVSQAQTLTE